MNSYAFPEGHYFSVIGNIRIGAGGQTRMALLRHRLMQTHAGVTIPLVTFNPLPSYDPIRENLLSEGLLLPDSQLLNMHESLRERDYLVDSDQTPAPPEPNWTVEETYTGEPDGTPWRIFVRGAHSGENHWDYLRQDGSRYLRAPVDSMIGTTQVFDKDERVVADLDGLGELWRWWIMSIAPDDGPVFLISDSRFIAYELGMLDDPRVCLLHQVHNPHQGGKRTWNSPVSGTYRQSMEALGWLDAMVLLTERQKSDIEMMFGASDNLVAIPNPLDPVEVPASPPKRPHGRIVMVARLDNQKRLDLAVSAFEELASKNAVARLDIYGDGPDREALQLQIDAAGLGDRITLHGHTPNAADQFWSADLGWLTSEFEGWSLALLEGRLRGCPFVAFDCPYGPSEQIDNGVDGVLVPRGDTSALTSATLNLLANPDDLEAMREPARLGALSHGFESYLHEWAAACAAAQDRKPGRTHITKTRLHLDTLRASGSHPHIVGRADVVGSGDPASMKLRWQMWLPESPAPVDLPLTFTVTDCSIHFEGRADVGEIGFAPSDPRLSHRLLLEWGNSTHSFDLTVRRPESKIRRAMRKGRHKRS